MMMTNKEKYKQAFGVLHASEKYDLEVIEDMRNKKVFKPGRKLVAACLGVLITMSAGATVYAAYHFLSPSQVAMEMYDNTSIADAFEGENAIRMNESVTSDGYTITLLGITSGTGLNNYFDDAGKQVETDEMYAVVAIENADGTPMHGVSDDSYDLNKILVTPFIGGQEPWKVNIYSLDGGYTEICRDGIVYRLISCKNLNVFADRGVYIGVCHELSDINQGFRLNVVSGAIERNENYEGLNALFSLPLDETMADKSEADRILEQILNPSEENEAAEDSQDLDFSESMPKNLEEWHAWIEMGMSGNDVNRCCHLIEGSEVVVKADENGVYEWTEDGYLRASVDSKFLEKDNSPHVLSCSSSDTIASLEILTYVYNEDGTVTFATYTPNIKND